MRGRLSGVAGAAVLIGAITILARVAGTGRTLVFSATVGKTCLSTSYFTANQIPNIIFEIVAGGALASMVVPVLAGPVERGDREHVARTASAMLTWVVAILTPLALLAALLAGPIIDALLHSAGEGCHLGQSREVATRMLVVFAPQIVLYGVAVVLYGVLQAHRRFTGPALAPLVSSLVVIGAYVAYVPVMGSHRGNDLAGLPEPAELVLSWGTTGGVVALVATAAVFALPVRLPLRPALRFPDGVARRVLRLAVAGLATVVAQQLAMLAVVVLQGRGTTGAFADYNYAWAVYLLPWAILAVPIATSAFPVLSARIHDGDVESFDRITASTSRAVLLVSCAGVAALVAGAWPVARVFDGENSPYVLARAVVAFAPGLLGYGLVAHLGRVLFASGQGRASAGATVTGWLVVLVADVALVLPAPRGGVVAALGLGNTVGMTVAGLLLVAALVRRRGAAAMAGAPRAALAGIAGIVGGGAAGWAVAHLLTAVGGRWYDKLANAGAALAAAGVAVVVFAVVVFAVDGRDLKAVIQRRVARDESA